jgi:hypothetical protein
MLGFFVLKEYLKAQRLASVIGCCFFFFFFFKISRIGNVIMECL